MKFKPPCRVSVDGSMVFLRHISRANADMKRRGWKGLVAHVQSEKGAGLVEYRKLRNWLP